MKVLRISSKRMAKVSQREPKGAKREPQGAKREPTGAQSEPLGGPRVPKVSQGATKMQPKIDLRKRSRKGSQKVSRPGCFLAPFWGPFPLKIPSKIRSKIDSEKSLKIMPTNSQNGAEIDAKTHQKSMPKLVSKKIKKIMNNNVFLKG